MESLPNHLFDDVPGPTPWYVRPGTPTVEGFAWQQKQGLAWKDATEPFQTRGKTLLVGQSGIVAVFDFYNWIMRLDESTLIAWNQGRSPLVHLVVFRPSLLPSFETDLENVERRMSASASMMELAGQPLGVCRLSTVTVDADVKAEFPPELQCIDELLILCHSPAIRSLPGMKADLALLIAKPKDGVIRLYPQDWFNSADFDLGYQWVTRVVRHPKTRRIHGEGFRIAPFELDDGHRRIRTTQ